LQHPGQAAIAGGGKVDQLGMFTSAASGISLSNLLRSSTLHWLISNIRAEQVND
jgi:hypothetical protein